MRGAWAQDRCGDGGRREVRRGRWAVMDGDSGNDGEEKPLTIVSGIPELRAAKGP